MVKQISSLHPGLVLYQEHGNREIVYLRPRVLIKGSLLVISQYIYMHFISIPGLEILSHNK
jgi:hypothetical protein